MMITNGSEHKINWTPTIDRPPIKQIATYAAMRGDDVYLDRAAEDVFQACIPKVKVMRDSHR